MDEELWDYVSVHEPLHFFVPNHGKQWENLMRARLGDHQIAEARLKEDYWQDGQEWLRGWDLNPRSGSCRIMSRCKLLILSMLRMSMPRSSEKSSFATSSDRSDYSRWLFTGIPGHNLRNFGKLTKPASHIRDFAERLDAHHNRQQAQHPKLTFTALSNAFEKLRADTPFNAKE